MISGALTLLTNAVIAYNTWKLHQVLERSRETGQPVPSDEILAHIAPIAFRHINFQGIYRFPLERYLDRLVPSALPGTSLRAPNDLSTGNRYFWQVWVNTPERWRWQPKKMYCRCQFSHAHRGVCSLWTHG